MPSNTATFVVGEILACGRVRRAWLGVAVEEVLVPAAAARSLGLAKARGVSVRHVERGSPAAAAGLLAGDVIVKLAGEAVGSVADVHRRLDRNAIGVALEVEVLREGRRLALEARPAEVQRSG